jgi:hypothetical protein
MKVIKMSWSAIFYEHDKQLEEYKDKQKENKLKEWWKNEVRK